MTPSIQQSRPARCCVSRSLGLALMVAALVCLPASKPSFARNASFITPGPTSTSNVPTSEGAVRIEPRGDVDTGESILNVARRITLFFVNQSGSQVQIEKIALNSDGNVAAEITADDCSKQGVLTPTVRCSVEMSITPSTPGPWSVEVLMTHNGAGRIARAKLMGKTTGSAAEKQDNGLSLSTKDIKPIDFGSIDVGQGKIVRSALMVNDSPEPITLYAVDVIEAENGLQKLEQGCAIDMELKSGESCPVTLVWTPAYEGMISTDLIIRHSGRLGFAVIPIRGTSKGNIKSSAYSSSLTNIYGAQRSGGDGAISALAPPIGAHDVEKALSSAASNNELGQAPSLPIPVKALQNTTLRLIGTIGHRAIILKPDGETTIVEMGGSFPTGGGTAKVKAITAKSVDISFDGKRITLPLEASPELIAKAPSLNHGADNEEKDGKTTTAKKLTKSPASSSKGMGTGSAGSGG